MWSSCVSVQGHQGATLGLYCSPATAQRPPSSYSTIGSGLRHNPSAGQPFAANLRLGDLDACRSLGRRTLFVQTLTPRARLNQKERRPSPGGSGSFGSSSHSCRSSAWSERARECGAVECSLQGTEASVCMRKTQGKVATVDTGAPSIRGGDLGRRCGLCAPARPPV